MTEKKRGNTGQQSTREVVDERCAIIEELMLKGLWTLRTTRQLAATWGISPRQVQNYRTRVEKDRRRKAKLRAPEDEREDFLARLRHAQADALKAGDRKALANMYMTELRVLGLEKPQRVEVSGPGGGPVRLDHDVKAATTEALMAELEALGGGGKADE